MTTETSDCDIIDRHHDCTQNVRSRSKRIPVVQQRR